MLNTRTNYLALALGFMMPLTALAHETHGIKKGDITIDAPYSRAMLPVAKVGAAISKSPMKGKQTGWSAVRRTVPIASSFTK